MKTFKQFQEGLAANVARVVAAGTLSLMGLDTIKKMNKNKEKMDKGEKFRKRSTMYNIQKKNKMLNDLKTGNY